ncbi:hypothetical protein ACIA3K_06500 [Micromonospora sp. NPDC051543]|uniref:hypothetical protein n=1 Tax=Micromonospora sp. NPDC051543 TaxID=3364287 RepID=UPI0037BA270D
MSTNPLGTSARQALVALMTHVSEASNPDLYEQFRMRIEKSVRQELEEAGFIAWRKGLRGTIIHELTEKGWERARHELGSAAPDRVSSAWLLHYGTLTHLNRLLTAHNLQLADLYVGPPGTTDVDGQPALVGDDRVAGEPDGIEDRVREAYLRLAETPGSLVSLARLRRSLEDVARDDLDRVLRTMDRRREIQLEPDPNRKALTQAVRDAAVVIGGEDKHLITIDQS